MKSPQTFWHRTFLPKYQQCVDCTITALALTCLLFEPLTELSGANDGVSPHVPQRAKHVGKATHLGGAPRPTLAP